MPDKSRPPRLPDGKIWTLDPIAEYRSNDPLYRALMHLVTQGKITKATADKCDHISAAFIVTVFGLDREDFE